MTNTIKDPIEKLMVDPLYTCETIDLVEPIMTGKGICFVFLGEYYQGTNDDELSEETKIKISYTPSPQRKRKILKKSESFRVEQILTEEGCCFVRLGEKHDEQKTPTYGRPEKDYVTFDDFQEEEIHSNANNF